MEWGISFARMTERSRSTNLETQMVTLRIYDASATKLVRESQHVSRAAALRALARFEAKYGRHPNAID